MPNRQEDRAYVTHARQLHEARQHLIQHIESAEFIDAEAREAFKKSLRDGSCLIFPDDTPLIRQIKLLINSMNATEKLLQDTVDPLLTDNPDAFSLTTISNSLSSSSLMGILFNNLPLAITVYKRSVPLSQNIAQLNQQASLVANMLSVHATNNSQGQSWIAQFQQQIKNVTALGKQFRDLTPNSPSPERQPPPPTQKVIDPPFSLQGFCQACIQKIQKTLGGFLRGKSAQQKKADQIKEAIQIFGVMKSDLNDFIVNPESWHADGAMKGCPTASGIKKILSFYKNAGKLITHLEEMNFSATLAQDDIDQLKPMLETVMQELHHAMIQLHTLENIMGFQPGSFQKMMEPKNLEQTFNLQPDSLQGILSPLTSRLTTLCKTLGVTPPDETNVLFQSAKNAFLYQKNRRDQFKQIRQALSDFSMNAETPIHELIQIKALALSTGTPEVTTFASVIDSIIAEKTGLPQLNAAIYETKQRILGYRGKAEVTEENLQKLRELYNARNMLREKIINAATQKDEIPFSWQPKQGQTASFVAIQPKAPVFYSSLDSLLQATDKLLEHSNHDYRRAAKHLSSQKNISEKNCFYLDERMNLEECRQKIREIEKSLTLTENTIAQHTKTITDLQTKISQTESAIPDLSWSAWLGWTPKSQTESSVSPLSWSAWLGLVQQNPSDDAKNQIELLQNDVKRLNDLKHDLSEKYDRLDMDEARMEGELAEKEGELVRQGVLNEGESLESLLLPGSDASPTTPQGLTQDTAETLAGVPKLFADSDNERLYASIAHNPVSAFLRDKRNDIIAQAKQYLGKQIEQQLENDLVDGKLYRIHPQDTLLYRNLKSLLNVLRQLAWVSMQLNDFQDRLLNESMLNKAFILLPGANEIKSEIALLAQLTGSFTHELTQLANETVSVAPPEWIALLQSLSAPAPVQQTASANQAEDLSVASLLYRILPAEVMARASEADTYTFVKKNALTNMTGSPHKLAKLADSIEQHLTAAASLPGPVEELVKALRSIALAMKGAVLYGNSSIDMPDLTTVLHAGMGVSEFLSAFANILKTLQPYMAEYGALMEWVPEWYGLQFSETDRQNLHNSLNTFDAWHDWLNPDPPRDTTLNLLQKGQKRVVESEGIQQKDNQKALTLLHNLQAGFSPGRNPDDPQTMQLNMGTMNFADLMTIRKMTASLDPFIVSEFSRHLDEIISCRTGQADLEKDMRHFRQEISRTERTLSAMEDGLYAGSENREDIQKQYDTLQLQLQDLQSIQKRLDQSLAAGKNVRYDPITTVWGTFEKGRIANGTRLVQETPITERAIQSAIQGLSEKMASRQRKQLLITQANFRIRIEKINRNQKEYAAVKKLLETTGSSLDSQFYDILNNNLRNIGEYLEKTTTLHQQAVLALATDAMSSFDLSEALLQKLDDLQKQCNTLDQKYPEVEKLNLHISECDIPDQQQAVISSEEQAFHLIHLLVSLNDQQGTSKYHSFFRQPPITDKMAIDHLKFFKKETNPLAIHEFKKNEFTRRLDKLLKIGNPNPFAFSQSSDPLDTQIKNLAKDARKKPVRSASTPPGTRQPDASAGPQGRSQSAPPARGK